MLLRTIALRILSLVPTLLVASVVVFFAINLVPGNAATAALGMNPTPEAIAAFNARYGLDKPLPAQYLTWITATARGDFGVEHQSEIPITPELGRRVTVTAELAFLGMLVALLVGIPGGIVAGWFHRTRLDSTLSALAAVAMSMPAFWLASLLVLAFALKLRIVPSGGYISFLDDPLGNLSLMVLPAVSIGLVFSTLLFRMMRASMIEVLSTEYILAARARGNSGRTLIVRHALRNTAIPVLTSAGLQIGSLFGGAVVIEQIFILPGLGSYIVTGIQNRDAGILQASVLVVTAMVIGVNALVDIAAILIDPRRGSEAL